MKKIDLSIVTVGFKSQDTIIPFLDSVKKSRDNLSKEVIFVDNYPLDKAADLAKSHSLKPTVIRNLENIGFSKAINQGIDMAKGKYVLVANPDGQIVGNCLEALVGFAEKHDHLGAVAPRLLNYDGKVQPSVFKFPTILNAIKFYFFNCKNCFNKYNPGNKVAKVDIAVMAAFMIPMSTIKKVGKLDEGYFLYYEDVEYCRRLKKFNLPVYYLPSAKVKHMHGASGSFTSHLSSPLAKSAQTYHGTFGSFMLNATLWIGQKWQKVIRLKRK